MAQRHPLGERFPKIEMIGCYIEARRLNPDERAELFRNDLARAKHLAADDRSGYFSRKARLIESAMDAPGKGGLQEVGYGPGQKYVYPGLPLDFAEEVDLAIRDIIDLAARCDAVAMTGLCCAGHPSSILKNPEYTEKPAMTRHFHESKEFGRSIYSSNISPYITLLLRGEHAGLAVNRLLEVSAEGAAGGGRVVIEARKRGVGCFYHGFPKFTLYGRPKLHIPGNGIGYTDFVSAYQKALCGFWSAVARVFSDLSGLEAVLPKPGLFIREEADWDCETEILRSRWGKGLDSPNYYYFFGRRCVVLPEFERMPGAIRS